MCDYFWHRMENDSGELADIVRAGGRSGPSNTEFEPVAAEWRLPSHPPVFFPTRAEIPTNAFGDPFVNLRDPLLDQFTGVEFFDGAEAMVAPASTAAPAGCCSGHVAPKLLLTSEQEMKGPCNVFSRAVHQISPGGSSMSSKPSLLPSRLVRPSPASSGSIAGPADHGGGVQQISSPRPPVIKRRKNQAKKVVCIPAPPPAAAGNRLSGEVVPSDLWAWRKYGQKPIKGSPYPRGYYRCSSSKGCSARKQVERSRTDPNMLVITYTSDHNHPWPTQRNALAGSTRSQPSKNGPRNNLKEEPNKETTSSSGHMVKEEEIGEMEKTIEQAGDTLGFDPMIHPSYKSDQPDDLFAGLAELEGDPMSLIFSRGFMESKPDEEKGVGASDAFDMFDWAGGSSRSQEEEVYYKTLEK
ncbi:unnamed protein product [Musa acuminata subsp. malaccensis]|uniref:(wild Malaysian banana) hypothetical protein n=1 Tax=Musa acuminata subsp. malaccensis TaxID=214687 RepID=A0A804IWZ5_MUSAM|nr:PREDICTED: probable WRKY transcription factor 14 [Musa acuminata subsp. malaccensis]CAG1844205.1 unnamed protein product [Musa acuminata subsp. malaccensis]